jgi:hypothetical protein
VLTVPPKKISYARLFVKKQWWGVAGLLLAGIVLSGCGKGTGHTTVLADVPSGFTSGSLVQPIDDNTYFVGVEAVLPPGFSRWSFPFQLPPGRTITSVQGTVAHRSACFSQALGTVAVDGKKMSTIVKLGANGGASTVFVNYTIPVSYTNGDAAILLEADPVSSCTGTTTWEFQGMIKIE